MADYASRDEMLAAFGPFAAIFQPMGEDKTPYLSLLGLQDEGSTKVIRAIRNSVNQSDTASYVLTLLRDVNWRPHLVGAIACYYDTNDDSVAQMWAAVDAGSWVTPQLTVVLSLCDDDFVDNASRRLDRFCPLSSDPEYSLDSPIQRHSAQGPAGSSHRSSKTAASLLALLPADIGVRFDSNTSLQKLVADDFDGSAETATSWRQRFLDLDLQL